MDVSDQIWLCEQNIRRFRNQLAHVDDEQRRTLLRELLASELTKYDRFTSSPDSGVSGR